MHNLIRKSAAVLAIAIDIRKFKEKAVAIGLRQRMLSGATIMLSILFALIFPYNLFIGAKILIVLNIIDVLAIIHRKKENKTKLYADRLSEGIIFSTMPFPWQALVVINFILTFLHIEIGERIPVLPLKSVLLLFLILDLA